MAPPLLPRSVNDDPSLLTLIKLIPTIAWLLIKSLLLLIGVFAFIGIIGYAIVLCLKLVWYSPWFFGRARMLYAAQKERRAEAGGTELEPLDGGGEGDEDVDGETLYDGGEEGKGMV